MRGGGYREGVTGWLEVEQRQEETAELILQCWAPQPEKKIGNIRLINRFLYCVLSSVS